MGATHRLSSLAVSEQKASALDEIVETWQDQVYDYLLQLGLGEHEVADARAKVFEAVAGELAAQRSSSVGALVMHHAVVLGGPALLRPVDAHAVDELVSAGDADLDDHPVVETLLWNSAGVLGPPGRTTLDLHFRRGMDAGEVASVLEQGHASVLERIEKLPVAYEATVRASLVWYCESLHDEALETELQAAGVVTFDPDAVRVISRAIAADEQLRRRVTPTWSPLERFAAIPIVAAPGPLHATDEPDVPEKEQDLPEDEPPAPDGPGATADDDLGGEPEPEALAPLPRRDGGDPLPPSQPDLPLPPEAVTPPETAALDVDDAALDEPTAAPEPAPVATAPTAAPARSVSPGTGPDIAAEAERARQERNRKILRVVLVALVGALLLHLLRSGGRKNKKSKKAKSAPQ